jgi:hypothetical protein
MKKATLFLDFDLLTSVNEHEVGIVCTRLKDGGKKWELIVADETYLLEPDDPSMDEDDEEDVDGWCFCDLVDINFWRDASYLLSDNPEDYDELIRFSIYPVDEQEGEDGGSTFTNTNVDPVRGIVEFINEQ